VILYNKFATVFNKLAEMKHVSEISRAEFIEAVKTELGKNVWLDNMSEFAVIFLTGAKTWMKDVKVKADAALRPLADNFDSASKVTVSSAVNKGRGLIGRITGACALLSHKILDGVGMTEAKREDDADRATITSVADRVFNSVQNFSATKVKPIIRFDPFAMTVTVSKAVFSKVSVVAHKIKDMVVASPLTKKADDAMKGLQAKPQWSQLKQKVDSTRSFVMDTPLNEMPATIVQGVRQRMPGSGSSPQKASEIPASTD